jgi:DNA (cytosine-5)-methyltransferase 1
MITYGSGCSGIESASVAWESLDFKPLWFAEIDAFPCAVLSYRWPTVPNLGDLTLVAQYVRYGLVPAPDIFVAGTPCQSYSVAGKRAGLDDPRGALTLAYVDILDAIDEKRVGNECVALWENVPGVLSDKGNAFGQFLGKLAGESSELLPAGGKWSNAGCVYGPKRAVAWRVLDAQYFGVAQRRRRVFLVASARSGFEPASVLFEFNEVRRDSPPSRETQKAVDSAVTASAGSRCESEQSLKAYRMVAFGEYADDDLASTMQARDYKDATDLVAYGIPGNLIGRKPENGGNATLPMYNKSPCLTATDRHGVQYGAVVRRLTPIEHERLQGFPDDYTRVPWRGRPATDCPDGPRYKAIGNSKAVPCLVWLGRRIKAKLEQLRAA